MSKSDLIPFVKGQSGNPSGRPKGALNTKTILTRFLSIEKTMVNPLNGLEETLSIAELLSLKQIANAVGGDLQAYREIMDRLEGKAIATVETTNDNDNKTITVGYSDDDSEFIEHESVD